MKPTSKNKLSPKQYEELGKIVAAIYETGYLSAAKSYKMSFFKGVVQGFGGVIGATLVVAILVWIVSLLGTIPLLDKVVNIIKDTIEINSH